MSPLWFVSWRRPAILDQATASGGRLSITIKPELTDDAGGFATGALTAVFRSPADIGELGPETIRHRAPAPGVMDAEATKWVHIDFRSPDLPWRYTPLKPDGKKLRPWLALLVGTEAELKVTGRLLEYSTATTQLLADPAYRLTDSHLWAHVQAPDAETEADAGVPAGTRFSRLLSLRALKPQTRYRAILVPTFNQRGADMWDALGKINNDNRPIPVFDSWSFATGEGGDFETLAAALHIDGVPGLGRAKLTYRRKKGDYGPPLETRGALSSLQTPTPDIQDQIDKIAANLHSLSATPAADKGPKRIGLPHYGTPWIDGLTEPTQGWPEELYGDPRHRVHAGTGVRMGVVAQDDLMTAAAEQAGALQEAAARIAQLASGLHLSGRHWARDLPADPVARLAALGPMMGRLEASDGGTVADVVGGVDTHLSRELFTGAGQRLLRRGRRRSIPGPDARALLRQLNEGPPRTAPDPESEAGYAAAIREQIADIAVSRDLREIVAAYLGEMLQRARELRSKVVRVDPENRDRLEDVLSAVSQDLADTLVTRHQEIFDGRCAESIWATVAARSGCAPQPEAVGFARQMLAEGTEESMLYEILQRALLMCLAGCGQGEGRLELLCSTRVTWGSTAPAPRAHPVKLEPLAGAIGATIDPRLGQPPAWRRLGQRLIGLDLTTLSPPRYPLGLDYPTWSLLRKHDPDWLLPGANLVKKDTITALQTNPAFIDAYLLGLNRQFHAETRWRGMPTDPWGTPLRMFFGAIDPDTHARARDITPIASWTDDSVLGAATHLPRPRPGESAEQLVILFHTSLFRRYPRTVVYLHPGGPGVTDAQFKEPPDLVRPAGKTVEQWYATRKDVPPVFTGTLSPDLVFFVFDVAPSKLASYWLMLDEPPSELRFGPETFTSQEVITKFGSKGSALMASDRLDHPTRIAISGKHLDDTAKDPE